MAQKSGFQFKDFIVTESFIARGTSKTKNEFDFRIEPSGIIDHQTRVFQLTLDFFLQEEDSNLAIRVVAIGFFTFSGDFEEIKEYFTINAPAIMFPYLRSYISAITALSGIDTIIIPTLNLLGMKEELEENITEKKNGEDNSVPK
ncbi:MAG: hypothetical protein RLP14_08330 [Owenweeksia sp.]